jgi:hypothetical protein
MKTSSELEWYLYKTLGSWSKAEDKARELRSDELLDYLYDIHGSMSKAEEHLKKFRSELKEMK